MTAAAITRFDTGLLPLAVIAGLGSRARVAAEVEGLNLQRLMIVASGSLRRSTSFVDELQKALGARVALIYDGIGPHNPDTQLMKASALGREAKIDGVLSIGGGAIHDGAKVISMLVASGREIPDLMRRFEPPATFHPPKVNVQPLPVLTIPSTFSAAEVLGGGGVKLTARNEKVLVSHPGLRPVRVFLDGEIVATTPRETLAPSGMNAVHHCLEALYSKGRQPISDAFALTALAELLQTLPYFAPGLPKPPIEIYQRAINASAMSGMTYGNSSLGVGHSICHSLGGRYGISHGQANSVMVRHSLRFNAMAAAPQMARAARAAGASFKTDEEGAERMIELIDDLTAKLQTPRTLREVGLPEGQFDKIAHDVMGEWLTFTNPRPVQSMDVIRILEGAW